jgi:undecaprenyl-diphosphatase
MIEQLFASLTIVALGWIITGLILLSVRHLSPDRRLNELSLKQAVIIGLVQAAAIVPGISRSGSTIGAGLMSGLTPEKAFNFSFHLSIPAILGAFVLQLKTVFENNIPIAWVPITLGWFAATVSGYVALTVLQRLVTSKRLYLFGYYCLAIGVITLILYVLPW